MYNDSEKDMNSGKRTRRQTSTRRMDTDRHKREGVTKRDNNRMNKNRETDK